MYFSIVQYSRVEYSRVQYSTVHNGIVQYIILQYTRVHYSTVQSTVQYASGCVVMCCDVLRFGSMFYAVVLCIVFWCIEL